MSILKKVLRVFSYILIIPFSLVAIINFTIFIYQIERKISDKGLIGFFNKISISPTCTGIGIDCLDRPFYTVIAPWIFLALGLIFILICYGFYKLGRKLQTNQDN